jgi:hypothetical protein
MKHMLQRLTCLLFFSVLAFTAFAQPATEAPKTPSVYESIMGELKDFKIDTSAVPDDKITRKINELRQLGGVFNINGAVAFKLEEERSKKEKPAAEIEKMAAYLQTGRGKTLLDNAITWIYRKEFTYRELKDLVKFYKTSAGKKTATRFPAIMLKSLAAAQIVHDGFSKQ